MTTDALLRPEVSPARLYVVKDANRSSRFAVLRTALKVLWVLLRERPGAVVSTGAGPGYIAVRLGGLLGARTVWIDSVANADELSLSGRMASTKADLCLTQWPHLVEDRVEYWGAVL